MAEAGDDAKPDSSVAQPLSKKAKMAEQVAQVKGKNKGNDKDKPNDPKGNVNGKGKNKKGKGKKDKPALEQMQSTALYPTSLNSLSLGFSAKDENVNIMIPPGTLMRDYRISKEISAAFSSTSKSDKVKGSTFLEVMRDSAALNIAVLYNYVRWEDPTVFVETVAGQTFRPYLVLKDKLVLQIQSVDIGNVSCRRLKYTGELNADNRIVYGPTSLSELLPDTQPGVPSFGPSAYQG